MKEKMEKQWDKKLIDCHENYRVCVMRIRRGRRRGAECVLYGTAQHGCVYGKEE